MRRHDNLEAVGSEESSVGKREREQWIGRASGRERVKIFVVDGEGKKKEWRRKQEQSRDRRKWERKKKQKG